jgi:hypothetical protein
MPMARAGRNDLCPCGSGQKYKKCCETKERGGAAHNRMMLLIVGGAVVAAILAGIAQFTGERSTGMTRIWSAEHGHYHDANGVAVP